MALLWSLELVSADSALLPVSTYDVCEHPCNIIQEGIYKPTIMYMSSKGEKHSTFVQDANKRMIGKI